MEPVLEALKAVDAAVSKCKGKEKKRLAEIAGHVSSHLVLLKLHSISQQVAQKLSTFFRESLRILYKGVTLSALHLTSTLFKTIYYECVLPTIGSMQRDQQGIWELVLHALLAGVLDFLDENDTKQVKSATGEALYPSICEVCFSLTAPMTSVDLRCTAYNILSDSAALHQGNQQRLREKEILGGQRLGSCIWRTKDYLALEGLLNLFARALPSTNNSASGRAKRTAYIHSVFKSCVPPEALGLGAEICELLENVPTSNWEDTAMKIVDVLAKGNLAYPQPFILQSVIACNRTYPSDRLYADDKAFLANVLLGDDQYESLEIAYSSITNITRECLTHGDTRVTVFVDRPARLGKNPVGAEGDRSADLSSVFIIRADEFGRFTRALQSRNLGRFALEGVKPSHTPKLSLATAPANLELDSAGRLVPEPSQSERIESVSQFYKTDERSDVLSSGDAEAFNEPFAASALEGEHPPTPPGGPMNLHEAKSSAEILTKKSENLLDATIGLASKHLNPHVVSGSLSRTNSHLMRAAAFGLSDEELSEISDYDSPLPRPKALNRPRTSASLVRGRISFQTVAPKSTTGTSSSATRVTRGGVGRVILDSDDDSPPAAPPSLTARRTKKMNLACSFTVDETRRTSAPLPLLSATIAVPASETPLPLPGDETLVSSSAAKKVLRFSDIPAPDFNAPISSPAVVPKSALKSALAKKAVSSHLDNAISVRLESALDLVPSATISVVASKKMKELALEASNILGNLAPLSSSPTPAAKKSIKSNLRKKEAAASTAIKGPQYTSKKRKASPENDVEVLELLATEHDIAETTTKRARTTGAPATTFTLCAEDTKPKLGIIDENSKSQALRPRITAAARATKKYRAKKGRTSPTASIEGLNKEQTRVDYDALPSPPRASVITVESLSPVPKMKDRATRKALLKTKDVAQKTEGGEQGHPETQGRSEARGQTEKKVAAKPRAARKTRAAAQKEAAESGVITSRTEPPSIRDQTAITTTQAETRRSRRVSHKADDETYPVDVAKEMNDTDTALPHVELAEPNRTDDDPTLPPLNCGDVASLRAEPENTATALAAMLIDPRTVSKTPQSSSSPTVSKRSNATPWDAAFEDVPRAHASEQRGISSSVKRTPGEVGESAGPTNADDGHSLESTNPIEENAVVLPSSETRMMAPVRTVRSSRAATSAPISSDMTQVTKFESLPDTGRQEVLEPIIAPVSIKKEVETIDLTLDSPPKALKQRCPQIVAVGPQLNTSQNMSDVDCGDDNIREYLSKASGRNFEPNESRPSRFRLSPSSLLDIEDFVPFNHHRFEKGAELHPDSSFWPRNRGDASILSLFLLLNLCAQKCHAKSLEDAIKQKWSRKGRIATTTNSAAIPPCTQLLK
ncbi:hypothetical protein C8Q79DRAFT_445049 [Trametes meyenii]|nr:hypothetical protein C8Q79DRAFT_445049 [Trametes meyenii]